MLFKSFAYAKTFKYNIHFLNKMHAKEHLQWLEKNNLLKKAQSCIPVLKKVFQECLAAKNEEVVIIGDKGYENQRISGVISFGYYLAAKELGLRPILIIQEPKLRALNFAGHFVYRRLALLHILDQSGAEALQRLNGSDIRFVSHVVCRRL